MHWGLRAHDLPPLPEHWRHIHLSPPVDAGVALAGVCEARLRAAVRQLHLGEVRAQDLVIGAVLETHVFNGKRGERRLPLGLGLPAAWGRCVQKPSASHPPLIHELALRAEAPDARLVLVPGLAGHGLVLPPPGRLRGGRGRAVRAHHKRFSSASCRSAPSAALQFCQRTDRPVSQLLGRAASGPTSLGGRPQP